MFQGGECSATWRVNIAPHGGLFFAAPVARSSEAVGVKTRSSVRPAICTRSGAAFGPRGLDRDVRTSSLAGRWYSRSRRRPNLQEGEACRVDREDDRNPTGIGGGIGVADRGGSSNGDAGHSRTRSNRGFASMDRDKQKEIASKGGKAAHAKGTAHEFDSSEAREAGRKGGVAVSRNREHMAAIGRRGGEARGHSRGRASRPDQHGQRRIGERLVSELPWARSDRQVAISNEREGVNANTQGTRGGDFATRRRATSDRLRRKRSR